MRWRKQAAASEISCVDGWIQPKGDEHIMHKGFIKGMVIGGMVGASVSMMMNSDMMSSRSGKKMMRRGKSLIRKSSNIIGDVADLFR